MDQLEINFQNLNRKSWIQLIIEIIDTFEQNSYIGSAQISLKGIEKKEDIEPFHFVLLACLIQYLKVTKGLSVSMKIENSEIYSFVFSELQFNRYWLDDYKFIETGNEAILNIWKVAEAEKEIHADRVHNYLKSKYFKGYDLSALKLSILELYYNIFDHSQSSGNAFSFIRYNQDTKILNVAVCDFGRGIANAIREKFSISKDCDAIYKAMEDGVTIGSQAHNKGRGLKNIIGVLFDNNNLKILSNKGFVCVKGVNEWNSYKYDLYENEYSFNGTLIYFDVSMDKFEMEETESLFEF